MTVEQWYAKQCQRWRGYPTAHSKERPMREIRKTHDRE